MQALGLLDVVLAVALGRRGEVGAMLVAHPGQKLAGVEHVGHVGVSWATVRNESASGLLAVVGQPDVGAQVRHQDLSRLGSRG